MNPNAREETFREALRLALGKAVGEEWEEMAARPVRRPVSLTARIRMRRILSGRSAGRTKRGMLTKVGIAVLAVLSVLAMLGMALRPVREAFIDTIITWYSTHFGVRYETAEPVPETVEEVVLPAWLPDGWTLETNFFTAYLYSHTILDADGHKIFLDQHVVKPDEEMDRFDNREVAIETVLLNGTTAAKLFSYTDGRQALMWTDKYVFILKTKKNGADAEMLVRIAESMEERTKS